MHLVFEKDRNMTMRMLMLRPNGRRPDGTLRRVPIVRERVRKYGQITDERVLSVKRDVLVCGPNASGKTRWLHKLNDGAAEVWAAKPKIFLRCTEPVQRWVEDPRVIKAAESHYQRSWSKLKAFEKADALVRWVGASRALLILDDAHKLAGRKLDLVMQMCRDCSRLVVGAWSENSLPMSLRMLLDKRDAQQIDLKSEAAYDITGLAIWMVIIAALMAGWWQLAAVMAGMKVLAGGRRANRQN